MVQVFSGAPTISNTIGAVVIGWGISSLFFGMLCIQVWTYYQRYPNDNYSYKVLVRPCCLCFINRGRPLTPFVLFLVILVLALMNARRRLGLRALVRPFRPVSIAVSAFIVDQGPGGSSPSFYWSHRLVLRRSVGSSRMSPGGTHHPRHYRRNFGNFLVFLEPPVW
jgi:hypothetical protein